MATATVTLTGTKVIECTCKHEFQDKKYGTGRRLHVGTTKGWRCTVCETTRS